MDAFTCADSVAGDFGSKSCVNGSCFDVKPLCIGPKQFTYNNVEDTLKILPPEDVHVYEELGIDENDNLEVAELGISFNEVLCVQDVDVKLSVCNPLPSGQNEIFNPRDGSICSELKFHQSGSSGVNTQKGLSKCTTFPCSKKVTSPPLCVDGREGIPSTPLIAQSDLKPENPCCTRSLSLPTTLKLVSAMKGGREQQGTPLKAKMNVKWAPDVYDPPVRSMSHTLKNHHHRPKSKKKDHHKHKGKYSRGCVSEKKSASRRRTGNINDPMPLRLQAPGDNLSIDSFVQSGAEVFDHAVSSQESVWNQLPCGVTC